MITAREPIYAALFSQVKDTFNGTVKTSSRKWQPPDQISPADLPALFQVQVGELGETSNKIAGLALRWHFSVHLVIYTRGDTDFHFIPSSELNVLLDALESAIPSFTPGMAQTLGGLVTDCRIEGKIEIVENVMGSMAMAVVPLTIITAS